MTSADDLKTVRRAYARKFMAAQVTDRHLENAFAEVRREDFLGPGPWPVFRFTRAYVPTLSGDPVYLYTDNLVGIAPERHINNG